MLTRNSGTVIGRPRSSPSLAMSNSRSRSRSILKKQSLSVMRASGISARTSSSAARVSSLPMSEMPMVSRACVMLRGIVDGSDMAASFQADAAGRELELREELVAAPPHLGGGVGEAHRAGRRRREAGREGLDRALRSLVPIGDPAFDLRAVG